MKRKKKIIVCWIIVVGLLCWSLINLLYSVAFANNFQKYGELLVTSRKEQSQQWEEICIDEKEAGTFFKGYSLNGALAARCGQRSAYTLLILLSFLIMTIYYKKTNKEDHN